MIMNIKDRILENLQRNEELSNEILEIIGYGTDEGCQYHIINELVTKWSLDEYSETLCIESEDGGYYSYILSSYGNRGERFYTGTHEGVTFVMAYDEEGGWNSACIYMLDNDNKVDDIED